MFAKRITRAQRSSAICDLSYADVAQSVEQLIRNQQVAGSSPAISSKTGRPLAGCLVLVLLVPILKGPRRRTSEARPSAAKRRQVRPSAPAKRQAERLAFLQLYSPSASDIALRAVLRRSRKASLCRRHGIISASAEASLRAKRAASFAIRYSSPRWRFGAGSCGGRRRPLSRGARRGFPPRRPCPPPGRRSCPPPPRCASGGR